MRYQEKVSTRADIRSLYGRVKEQPAISHYRGYTATKSYGWDEEVDDYIKADGEMWFENPYYDPDFFATHNEEQPMNELKPEDVMRALECCQSVTPLDCRRCPYKDQTTPEYKSCCNLLVTDALALLREKDAEIERLKKHQDSVATVCNRANEHYNTLYEQAKEILKAEARAEAITEFAERLKGFIVQNICVVDDGTDAIYKEINQIEKEMKEGGRWQN